MGLVSSFVRPMVLLKAKKISHHCGSFIKGKTLDFGAGRCYIAKELRDKHNVDITCVDLDSKLNETDMKLIVYDGKKLPFRDNSFDSVLVVYVLHHCDDPAEALKEIRRVCRNNAHIIIFEDFGPVMYTHAVDWLANKLLHDVEAPLHFKSREEWKRLFESLGMKLIYSEDGVEKQVFYPFIEHTMFVLKVNK